MRSPELGRGLGLHEVVDPGGAAAQLPVGGLHQLEVGDPAQQLARLGAHALRVGEVAGVVVGDLASGSGSRSARGPCLGEELGHIPHALRRTRAARSAHSGSSRSTWP